MKAQVNTQKYYNAYFSSILTFPCFLYFDRLDDLESKVVSAVPPVSKLLDVFFPSIKPAESLLFGMLLDLSFD